MTIKDEECEKIKCLYEKYKYLLSFKDREETNPHELNPTYLKNTAAEEALNDSRDNEE